MKKTRWSPALWFVLVILALSPAYYFVVRYHDQQFLDSVMSNLLAATFAVVVGIPIALEINRRQQRAQEEAQRKQNARSRIEKLQHLILHVGIELNNNRAHLKRLEDALNISQSSRTDLWELANAIADAFSFSVFAEFRKSDEVAELFPESNDILVCYLLMERLVHDVRIAALAHALAYSYGGGEPRANKERDAVLAEISATSETLSQAEEAQKRLTDRFNEEFKKLSSQAREQ